eukprot:TRINITY_DN4634_c0_g1_i1.p1 TRINITY_DN4634_c0_g1~~TRINITY_DN4634_c0_g1_i1.p1  ORF type:complete len:202 (-),score=34.61 TRINITY_DN4634_c0_g1_i1:386-991(-)
MLRFENMTENDRFIKNGILILFQFHFLPYEHVISPADNLFSHLHVSDLHFLLHKGMPMLATASVELIAFQTHCWEWLWSAMQYLVSHPLQLLLWNLGYFYSLTEREEAAAKLTQAGPDAVMLRLSCTQPGCVVIGKNNRDGCGVSWLKLTADELSDGHRLINRLLETKGKVVVGANGRHLPLEPLEKHSTKATPGYVPLFN